jgi:hypothetical protein
MKGRFKKSLPFIQSPTEMAVATKSTEDLDISILESFEGKVSLKSIHLTLEPRGIWDMELVYVGEGIHLLKVILWMFSDEVWDLKLDSIENLKGILTSTELRPNELKVRFTAGER